MLLRYSPVHALISLNRLEDRPKQYFPHHSFLSIGMAGHNSNIPAPAQESMHAADPSSVVQMCPGPGFVEIRTELCVLAGLQCMQYRSIRVISP